jgi:predicted heme/steroid binding protein
MDDSTQNTIAKRPIFVKIVVIGTSLMLAGVIIAGALIVSHGNGSASTAFGSVTKEELAAKDGKNGHDCYVAVDGIVYQIPKSGLWENGQHTPSNGQAYCGADLSNVIDKAPHGRSKLDELKKIGSLEN